MRRLVVDTLQSHSWEHKSSSSHDSWDNTSKTVSSSVTAGGTVAVTAGNDLTLQAAKLSSGGETALTAGGTVALQSTQDSDYHAEQNHRESMVWQSSQDKGHDDTTVVMTEIRTNTASATPTPTPATGGATASATPVSAPAAGGGLRIQAGKGIAADIRSNGDLTQSITALASQPGTAWVGQLAQRPDVNWRPVTEAHRQWDYKSQGLTGAAAAVIAIAVGEDAAGVNTANTVAQDARTYNRQLHVAEIEKLKELAPAFAQANGISQDEALRRLLSEALRDVDQTYYLTHAQWDAAAENYLRDHAEGSIAVDGRDVLMFAAGGMDFYQNPTLLADSWKTFQAEGQMVHQQTPIMLASDKFATQRKVQDAYLTAIGMAATAGRGGAAWAVGADIVITLIRYDDAVQRGDNAAAQAILENLPAQVVANSSQILRTAHAPPRGRYAAKPQLGA